MEAELRFGRYRLYGAIAAGGIGSVHLGRMQTDAGFWRTVAIKRLHPQHAQSEEMVASLVDEARIASRIRHTNVVPTLDAVVDSGETLLVMEYVAGESLAGLLRVAKNTLPLGVVSAIVSGALLGLHAAHEVTDDRGRPLNLVHRDVSPQNILVGSDGVARVLDFGIAKSRGRLVETTTEGALKGKLAYMAPEQFTGAEVDRRTDVFAAGIVLWESLTGRRLFRGKTEAEVLAAILALDVGPPSEHRPDCPPELDDVVMHALAQRPEHRFATAREFARALEEVVPAASAERVREIVEQTAGAALAARAEKVRQVEVGTTPSVAPPPNDSAPGVTPAPVQAPPDREAVTMTSVALPPEVALQPPPSAAREPTRAPRHFLIGLAALAILSLIGVALALGGVFSAAAPATVRVPEQAPTQAVARESAGVATSAAEPVITMLASAEPSSGPSATAVASVASSAPSWRNPSATQRPATTATASAPATASVRRCQKVKLPDGTTKLSGDCGQ